MKNILIIAVGSLLVLVSILLIKTVYLQKHDKLLSEEKHIKNLPNGGQIITTVNTYRSVGWTGSGRHGTNLYEYISPDSNIPEPFGVSFFDAGNSGLLTTEWISQNNIFIATMSSLFLRLKDSTWHEFVFMYRDFPGRNTDLGQNLISLNPDCEGYFEVINVGDENVWLPDFLRGSSILLEERGRRLNNSESDFYIVVSYYVDAKTTKTLKYRLDLTRIQLTLIEIR